MYAAPTMTSSQARETIDRLSEQTASLRRYGVATEAWIAEYNDSLMAFVPRDKMPHFYIGKGCYVGIPRVPAPLFKAASSADSSRAREPTSIPSLPRGSSNHPFGNLNVGHPSQPE